MGFQIALQNPSTGNILYSQLLVGDGYGCEEPYDVYVVDADFGYIDADVCDGTGSATWRDALCMFASQLDSCREFLEGYDICKELDADDTAEALMGRGVM